MSGWFRMEAEVNLCMREVNAISAVGVSRVSQCGAPLRRELRGMTTVLKFLMNFL